MITTTILKFNHLARFVALVTIKHLKLKRERETRSMLMSGGCVKVKYVYWYKGHSKNKCRGHE